MRPAATSSRSPNTCGRPYATIRWTVGSNRRNLWSWRRKQKRSASSASCRDRSSAPPTVPGVCTSRRWKHAPPPPSSLKAMSTLPAEQPKGRIRQIRQAYKITKRTDTNIGPILLLWLLVVGGVFGFPVSYTHLRAHETDSYLVCRLLLE